MHNPELQNEVLDSNEVFIDINEENLQNESYLGEDIIDFLSNVVFKIIIEKKETKKEDNIIIEEDTKKEGGIRTEEATGFLMKLKIANKFYYFIVTCVHCLKGKEDPDIPDKINLFYGKNRKKLQLN